MMKRDFTFKTFYHFLEILIKNDYRFLAFEDYIENQKSRIQNQFARLESAQVKHIDDNFTNISTEKFSNYVGNSDQTNNLILRYCVLRHDVDLHPENSLITAKIEKELGVRGSYYFRIIPESFNKNIIKEIAGLGHEIGYHYEELDIIRRNTKIKNKIIKDDIYNQAYELFKINLEIFRDIADVKTICMHGSPLSPYDNKDIWNKYNYRDLGIIGEPYFDMDWNSFYYLSDTGRRWNGGSVAVRDKVNSSMPKVLNELKSTQELVSALEQNKFPNNLMLNFHPQRWNDNFYPWLKELLLQNTKNIIKSWIVRLRT